MEYALIMPSTVQRRKCKTQFEIMSVPYCIVRVDHIRSARHGESQRQYDLWKSTGAKRSARKTGEKFHCATVVD